MRLFLGELRRSAGGAIYILCLGLPPQALWNLFPWIILGVIIVAVVNTRKLVNYES